MNTNDDPMDATTPPPGEPAPTQKEEERRPYRLAEQLLDPRGLQTLMLAGGGLLTLGLVLWLVVIGVFERPINAAIGLGVANLSLLGAGVWLAGKTRYRLAGRGAAMLACLVMPLNLWFYNDQGLLTLHGGGHLWLAALVCCVLYAGVARLLRDSLFVYAIASGVALTGLLFLADGNVERFWEVLAPSTLLVALGVSCVHAQRLFPESAADEANSAFTRDDFGLAFFRAGHALLASGLGLLLAGRLAGRFYQSVFHDLGWFEQPDVSTVLHVKLAALGIALVGAYTYGYSQLTARRGRRYTVSAIVMLAWSGVIGLDLLGIEFTEVLVVGMLGVVAIACRLALRALPHPSDVTEERRPERLLRFASQAASWGGTTLLLLQLVRGVLLVGGGPLGFTFTGGYLASAAILLVAELLTIWSPIAAEERPNRFVGLSFTTLAMTTAIAMLALGVPSAILAAMLVPAAVAVGAEFLRHSKWRLPLVRAAEVSGGVAGLMLAPYAGLDPSGFTLVATLTLAGVYLVAGRADRQYAGVLALLLVLAAGFQATVLYDLGAKLPLMLMGVASVGMLVVNRFSRSERLAVSGQVGLYLSAIAGGLLAGSRVLAGEADVPLLLMVAGQAALTGTAVLVSRPGAGRPALIGLGVGQVLVAGLVMNAVSTLTFGQRIEVFSTVVGVGLVVAGLVGWRREAVEADAPRDQLTDTNLWIGSLLATVPLTLGLVAVRWSGGEPAWVALHEIGVLAIGLALVGVGSLCRLRATTLAGGGAIAVYLVSLVTLLHIPDQLQSVAVYLIVGGATLFGGAVLLSVYRDRLLAIPGRMRDGEGVFAVLKWR